MSTTEKLFVEILRRKDRIIEQFKLQVEQFDPHLAATLLLNGITPPPWLLHSQSSVPKEWKKEELISEVLLPHPQVLIPYASDQHFMSDDPSVKGNKKFFTELSKDEYQLREQSDANDDQPALSEVLRCDLTDVAELNCPMKSPLPQIEGKISDPTQNLDLSLVRIQRSRTRQKALELRSSAKTFKTSLRDKCHIDVAQNGSADTGIVLSLSERIKNVEKGQRNSEGLGTLSFGIDRPPILGPIISEVQPPPVHESMQLMSSSMSKKDDTKFSKVCDISHSLNLEVGNIATNASPRVAESTDNVPLSGQCSGPYLKDLSPHRIDAGVETKLDETLSASQRLMVIPSDDGARGNCQYTKSGIEVDQEADRDEKIRAPLGNGSALQHLHGSESCYHKIPEESAAPGQFSISGLEDLGPQSGQGSVKAMFIKSPSSLLDLVNVQDGIPNRVEVYQQPNSERDTIAQYCSGSTLKSLRISPSTSQEVFQHGGSSGVEVDQELHSQEVITVQKDNVTSLQDLQNPESSEMQISEKYDSSSKYSVPGLGNVHLQSGQSTESRLIESPSPLMSLKFTPDTFHDNLQRVVSTRIEVDQETERKDVMTAKNGSANGKQDERCTRSCHLQILQYSDSGSEFLCHRSKQRSIELEVIKPSSGMERHKLPSTSVNSGHRNAEDRHLSRAEVGLVEPEFARAKDGGSSAQDLHCSESRDHQILENSVTSGLHSNPFAENLCAQPKQKSIESETPNPQSARHRLKITPLKSVHENSQDKYLSNIDVKVCDSEETCLTSKGNAEHSNVSCAMNDEVLQNLEQFEIKSPCSQMLHVDEVEVDLQLKERVTEDRRASLDRDPARQNLADLQVFLMEATEIDASSDHVDPVEQDECRWGEAENDSKLDGGHSAFSEEPLPQKSVPQLEASLLISANLIGSPPLQSLEIHKADPVMPVLEGFIMQNEDGKLCVSQDNCSFEKFNFEDPIVERTTATEEFCKSAYVCTPSSPLLAVDDLRKASNLYQSLPTMRNNFFAEDVNCGFNGKSYSDSFPFPVARNSENKACRSPPVRTTLWDRINSLSGSSRAKASLNPDLPCISEENEVADEIQGVTSEIAERSGKRILLGNIPEDSNCPAPVVEVENDALFGRCSLESGKRIPLANIPEDSNCPAPVEVENNALFGRCSLESTSSALCSTRTSKRRPIERSGTNRMSKKRCTEKMKTSTNMSRGTSVANSSKKSLHHRFSKPKPSLRKDRSDISVMESKRENIVCNVTSFLPLVQQKQAAGPLTGKRDVKVKALEAAEAAKRQAEKREMDRKLKKEAMKLERARMELENLRRLEQEKKQKEEERKKREAEIAARKRLREEEENKENERKRKRVEEARKQQEYQKEKLCSKKEEKEAKLRAMHEKKGVTTESMPKNKCANNWSSSEAVDSASVVPETFATPHNRTSSTQLSRTLCQASQENFTMDEKQEPSYDISPYRCSDDEEEDEEDGERNGKFIPFWASKSSISLVVATQQSLDPKAIFPRDSFCSISEVCLPRKYQLK